MSVLDGNGFTLFGLNIKKASEESKDLSGALSPGLNDDNSAISVASGNALGISLDIDGQIKTEIQAIQKYREISLYVEVDAALQDIVNEALPMEDDSEIITLELEDLEQPDNVKDKILEEFKSVKNLLKLRNLGADIFRRWYVDGRIYFQIIVDKNNIKDGIQELIPLDSAKIKKVKEVLKKRAPGTGADIIDKIDEYFIYNESGLVSAANQGLRINLDAIIQVTSGYVDHITGMTLSYLHKAIRPINQLRMLEDATVVYFIARAPERRVFYVDVGTLPKLKAEQHLKDIMSRYRNKMVYDSKTGDVKDDKKYMCLAMNTKVPLLDGRTLTIEEIASERQNNKVLWAYSCDPVTGKFAPGLITWAGVTRRDAKVVKITFDNGKHVICTPDHKFPTWNNPSVEAKDLVVGESMIPFYKREEKVSDKSRKYEQIFENSSKQWSFTHRLVSEWKDKQNISNEFVFNEEFIDENKKTVHHKNINRYDNSPDNLVRMNNRDHILYHQEFAADAGRVGGKACYEKKAGIFSLSDDEMKIIRSSGGTVSGKNAFLNSTKLFSNESKDKRQANLTKLMNDSEWNEIFRQNQRDGWTEEKRDTASVHAKRRNLSSLGNDYIKKQYKDKNSELSISHSEKYKTEYSESLLNAVVTCANNKMDSKSAITFINSNKELIEEFSSINKNKVMTGQKDYSIITKYDISRIVKLTGASSYKELKNDSTTFRNHKITKIEFLNETMDVGTLTIDGQEIYHNHHTFALESGVYTRNSLLEDFWMPRREGGKGTEVTILPGAQNITGYLDSLDWFKDKMYEALNVPKSRFKNDGGGFSVGRTSEITRDELKFQKFIDRLRMKFADLFLQVLKTQLILKGICNTDEWDLIKNDLKLIFQKDNYFSEFKEQDLLTSRLGLLQQADQFVGKYVSRAWIQRNIMKLTEEQAEEMDKVLDSEKKDPRAQSPMQQQMDMQQDQQDQMIQQQQTDPGAAPQGNPNQAGNSLEPEYSVDNYKSNK